MKEKKSQIIGSRLKMLRQYHRLSQKELAEKMDCSQQFISKYENGMHSMSVDLLLDFCDVLNVDLSYFDPKNSVVLYSEKSQPNKNLYEVRESKSTFVDSKIETVKELVDEK